MKTHSNLSRRTYKILAIILSLLLIFEQSGFAQALPLPNPFVPDAFRPLHLRYLSYDPINNNFKVLLDKGDAPNPKLQENTKTLLNYFYIGLTLPSESFWVNLRPDSEENIIDNELSRTDVGRIMLEADLQLKKDTAKATSPNTPEGKAYWDKLYRKAQELFGEQNIAVPTVTRVWIVPDEIILSETDDSVYIERGQGPSRSAYIYKATLKVLLEQDYIQGAGGSSQGPVYAFEDERLKTLNEYSSQLFREIIIPKLNKEVNASKRYAALRQVYYSLIMAEWFKARFSETNGTVPDLINSRNLTGLTSKEPWSKAAYFKAYQKSVNEGEYNIPQMQHDLTATAKSYVSGGVLFSFVKMTKAITGNGVKISISDSIMPGFGEIPHKPDGREPKFSLVPSNNVSPAGTNNIDPQADKVPAPAPGAGELGEIDSRAIPTQSQKDELLVRGAGFKDIDEARAVINATLGIFDTSLADYDAQFIDGYLPRFLNIWARTSGHNYGFIIFHKFLSEVRVGREFTSTDFTDAGRKLFEKAVNAGLIQQVEEPKGLTRESTWKVISDPIKALMIRAASLSPELRARISKERDGSDLFQGPGTPAVSATGARGVVVNLRGIFASAADQKEIKIEGATTLSGVLERLGEDIKNKVLSGNAVVAVNYEQVTSDDLLDKLDEPLPDGAVISIMPGIAGAEQEASSDGSAEKIETSPISEAKPNQEDALISRIIGVLRNDHLMDRYSDDVLKEISKTIITLFGQDRAAKFFEQHSKKPTDDWSSLTKIFDFIASIGIKKYEGLIRDIYKSEYNFLLDTEKIFGEQRGEVASDAKALLKSIDADIVNLLESPEREKLLRIYILAVLVVIQDKFPFLNREKYEDLVFSVLFAAHFTDDYLDNADSHFTISTYYAKYTLNIKMLLGSLAHEMMHNILDGYDYTYNDVDRAAISEFLCDISEFAFLEEMGWLQDIEGAFREHKSSAEKDVGQGYLSIEPHLVGRRGLYRIMQAIEEAGYPLAWDILLRLGIDTVRPNPEMIFEDFREGLLRKYQQEFEKIYGKNWVRNNAPLSDEQKNEKALVTHLIEVLRNMPGLSQEMEKYSDEVLKDALKELISLFGQDRVIKAAETSYLLYDVIEVITDIGRSRFRKAVMLIGQEKAIGRFEENPFSLAMAIADSVSKKKDVVPEAQQPVRLPAPAASAPAVDLEDLSEQGGSFIPRYEVVDRTRKDEVYGGEKTFTEKGKIKILEGELKGKELNFTNSSYSHPSGPSYGYDIYGEEGLVADMRYRIEGNKGTLELVVIRNESYKGKDFSYLLINIVLENCLREARVTEFIAEEAMGRWRTPAIIKTLEKFGFRPALDPALLLSDDNVVSITIAPYNETTGDLPAYLVEVKQPRTKNSNGYILVLLKNEQGEPIVDTEFYEAHKDDLSFIQGRVREGKAWVGRIDYTVKLENIPMRNLPPAQQPASTSGVAEVSVQEAVGVVVKLSGILANDGKKEEIKNVEGNTLGEALQNLPKEVREQILNSDGSLKAHVIVGINGKEITDISEPINPGDKISIMPEMPGASGEEEASSQQPAGQKNEDAHYQRMERGGSQYTKAIYEHERALSDALTKLVNITGPNTLGSYESTIVVVGFGENWQELTLLARKFPKCKIVGIDWVNRNIEEAKRHIEDRNVNLIQDDIRNVNLANYPAVSLIYMSYVIDYRLYNDDISAMNKIIERLISLLGKEGFIISIPANHVTVSLFEQNGLNILLDEGAGLKTVCIAQKPNPESYQLQKGEKGDASKAKTPVGIVPSTSSLDSTRDNPEGVKRVEGSPRVDSQNSKVAGIDFRNLPIVTRAIGNLSVKIDSAALSRLNSMNLDTEWQDIENSVNQGAIPQAERLKEYIQASCLKGSVDTDIDKVISCISDILRREEELYTPTEPMLIDILVAVESASSLIELKAVFIGNS